MSIVVLKRKSCHSKLHSSTHTGLLIHPECRLNEIVMQIHGDDGQKDVHVTLGDGQSRERAKSSLVGRQC